MVVPAHPQNPLLDAFASLIVPQIQNRINGSSRSDSATDDVGGMGGGMGVKISKVEKSQDDLEGNEDKALALSPTERNSLIADGIPDKYISEREIRAAGFAKAHKREMPSVLREWWAADKKDYIEPSTGSFDTDDFFNAALARSMRAMEER